MLGVLGNFIGVCPHYIDEIRLGGYPGGNSSLQDCPQDIQNCTALYRSPEHRRLLYQLLCSQHSLPQVIARFDVGIMKVGGCFFYASMQQVRARLCTVNVAPSSRSDSPAVEIDSADGCSAKLKSE
ncbi:MAG: hypothetical protein A2289_06210 [Deltaproteobacteria bacterium RIFOXYA12_FULL_58_15]|nr:MAG: hypothetical protein A2289_06210 [Deltaproteobacteria bacterium RIFOXYA12_FULL_58_15]